MNRQEAVLIIEESLNRPSATPNTSDLPREQFIEIEKAKLRAALIDPFPVIARPGDWAIKYCGLEDREYNFIAMAREETTWLLYDPESKEFFQGWNNEGNDDEIFLIGFSSDDALAEWRG